MVHVGSLSGKLVTLDRVLKSLIFYEKFPTITLEPTGQSQTCDHALTSRLLAGLQPKYP